MPGPNPVKSEPWGLGIASMGLGVLAAVPLVFTWGWTWIDQFFRPSDGPIGLWFFGSITSVVLGLCSIAACVVWSRRAPRPSRSWPFPGVGVGFGVIAVVMSSLTIVWIWSA